MGLRDGWDCASRGMVSGGVMLKDHSGALVVWGLLDLLTLSQQGPVPLPLQGEACFSLTFQVSLLFPALIADQTLTGASDMDSST